MVTFIFKHDVALDRRYNKLHILRSLTFFRDAEKDPMPRMLIALDWDEVKQFFLYQVPRII